MKTRSPSRSRRTIRHPDHDRCGCTDGAGSGRAVRTRGRPSGSLTSAASRCLLDRSGMDFGLTGCVAIVAGSSSGMGRACAMALARERCNVTLFARRLDLLDVVARTQERFGRLDIVVNNTGGPPAGGFDDFDDEQWRRAWELTLMSTLRLTRLALPALRRSGRGRIVNITSSAVKEPNEGLILSNTYRPGVIGWAKTLSQVEGPYGVTVNSIAPGYIDTERMKGLYALGDDPEGDRRRDEAAIPVGRFGDPAEIGDTVAFLCST